MSEDHGYRIGLARGNGPVSRLIKRETRSPYSHAYLLTPKRKVLESVAWHGMRVRKWEPGEVETTDFFAVSDCRLDQWQDVEAWMRDAVRRGVKYDYRAIFRWAAKLPMHVNGKVFCSEAIECGFKFAKRPLFSCEPQYVSPRDFSINNQLYPLAP